jgi:hypothetical protein
MAGIVATDAKYAPHRIKGRFPLDGDGRKGKLEKVGGHGGGSLV